MAKENGSRAFKPNDSTTNIRELLERERRAKTEFTNHIHDAAQLHGRARANLARIAEQMRAGQRPNLDVTRELVGDMFDSMYKNSNVLWLLTNIQLPQEHHACHSFNIAVLSMLFGRHRHMSKGEVIALGMGGMLHDVGKSRVPPLMLDKPAKLNEAELSIVRRHAEEGYNTLQATGQLTQDILEIVRCHHERIDGNGYPNGLYGDSVPELARMVAIADAYDSMTGVYGYRVPLPLTQALLELRSHAGEEYGLELVEDFIRCLGTYPVGSLVELNSGAVVLVIASNNEARLKPKVLLVRNEEGKFERPRMLADLTHYSEEDLAERWGIRDLVDPEEVRVDVRSIVLEEIQF